MVVNRKLDRVVLSKHLSAKYYTMIRLHCWSARGEICGSDDHRFDAQQAQAFYNSGQQTESTLNDPRQKSNSAFQGR